MMAPLVLAEAVTHDLAVAHRAAIPFEVIHRVVDPDLGIRANLRIGPVLAPENLRCTEPQTQLGQLHFMQNLIDLRDPAAEDVLWPTCAAANGADQPNALASHGAVEPAQG